MKRNATMRLASFRLADSNRSPIYINPFLVVAVEKHNGFTLIRMSGTNEGAQPLVYRVEEKAEVVMHRLSTAANL